MRIHALDIPDDPAQLPAWLDRHLAGPHLGELIAELSAVHGPASGAADDVEEFLGNHRQAVLEGGLAALSKEKLRLLLLQPRLLLDLQEVVLREGGPFWSSTAEPAGELRRLFEQGRNRLDEFLAAEARNGPVPRIVPLERTVSWYARPWCVSLATAAGVLVAVSIYQQYFPLQNKQLATGPTAREKELQGQLAEERQLREAAERRAPPIAAGPAWGWGKPQGLPEKATAAVYLSRLSELAGEWGNKRPDDPAALAKRLGEFRQGCTTLIFAEHRPLSAQDRHWLVERCRQWSLVLDKHIEDLEAGQDYLQIRAEVDGTVKKIVQALRNKAQEAATG